MKIRLLPFLLVACLVGPAGCAEEHGVIGYEDVEARFIPLTGAMRTSSWGLSRDGYFAVGVARDSTETVGRAGSWTYQDAFTPVGFGDGGQSVAYGTDYAGTVLVGYLTRDTTEWMRWSESEGFRGLGRPGIAYDVTDDGRVIVGHLTDTGAAAYFDASGFHEIGDLPGGDLHAEAYAVSVSGDVIVGFATTAAGTEAFRWTRAGGMVGLGYLGVTEGTEGQGYALSDDGSVVVGSTTSAAGRQAFRWTATGGMQGLGDLPGGSFLSYASGCDRTCSTIVGSSASESGTEAFVWTSEAGMRALDDVLIEAGVNLAGWTIENAWAVSTDGLIITGAARSPDGLPRGYLANLGPNR